MTDPISEVVFEDPPDLPRYDWAGIAKKVKARPGRWAKVFDRDRVTQAEAIRNGGVAALRREHGFETRTRNNKRETDPATGKETRWCTLYVRYNPANDTRKARK